MEGRIDAAVFPGQGSQRTGMGRDFFEQVPESRHTYEAADVLGWDIAAVCFADDASIFAIYPALYRNDRDRHAEALCPLRLQPTLFGGTSRQFTALVAAGALPSRRPEDCQERGRLGLRRCRLAQGQ